MDQTRKNLPAVERRAVTVEAVVELAATQNPSEITTAAIAKHMDLTQGALFRHFPSKEAIWNEVMKWGAERLMARLDRSIRGIDSPMSALETMFLGNIEFICEHPGIPRIMFGELQRAEGTAAKAMAKTVTHQYGERLRKLLQQGVERGELSADLDTQAAAILFIGTIQGLVMQSLMAGDIQGIRKHAPRVFAIYRRGIERKGS
jgi:AcrR family transcriptional regulator